MSQKSNLKANYFVTKCLRVFFFVLIQSKFFTQINDKLMYFSHRSTVRVLVERIYLFLSNFYVLL